MTAASAPVTAGRRLALVVRDAFHAPRTAVYRWVQGTIWILIAASIALLIVDSLVPPEHPSSPILIAVDQVLLWVFAVEWILRVGTLRPPGAAVFQRPPLGRVRMELVARLRFAIQPMQLIDLLAVLALFPGLRGLRALRLLRLLRTAKAFRYANPFTAFGHAVESNSLLFTLALTLMLSETLLGGVTVFLVEAGARPDLTLADCLWWALVTITTVGYGDITPVTGLGRIVGGFLMVGGMVTLSLFAGIIGHSLVLALLTLREEQFVMSDYVNHIVVCGYDETTHLLLDALRHELDLDETRVVLFDSHERPRALPPEFLWVHGDPTKQSELDKVRLTQAAAVIVAGDRTEQPQKADATTILTVFTIRAHLRSQHEEVRHRIAPLYIVAEVLDSENVDHARSAGADEVVETRRLGSAMLAHAIRFHGAADVMSSVLLRGAHNIYMGRIPEEHAGVPTFGQLMATMRLTELGALVIGLRYANGAEAINPARDATLPPGTQLIYLAEQPIIPLPGER